MRHELTAVGRTHASTVTRPTSSEAASATVAQSFTPSKDSAEPYFPAAVRVAPEIVPALPVPELSVTAVPVASSKAYAATRPGGVADCVNVAVSVEEDAGVVDECEAAPPSDHEANTHDLPDPSTCVLALTFTDQPSHEVTTRGAETASPFTPSWRPVGLVANVRSTLCGCRSRVTVVVRPRESVAVSWISR